MTEPACDPALAGIYVSVAGPGWEWGIDPVVRRSRGPESPGPLITLDPDLSTIVIRGLGPGYRPSHFDTIIGWGLRLREYGPRIIQ